MSSVVLSFITSRSPNWSLRLSCFVSHLLRCRLLVCAVISLVLTYLHLKSEGIGGSIPKTVLHHQQRPHLADFVGVHDAIVSFNSAVPQSSFPPSPRRRTWAWRGWGIQQWGWVLTQADCRARVLWTVPCSCYLQLHDSGKKNYYHFSLVRDK